MWLRWCWLLILSVLLSQWSPGEQLHNSPRWPTEEEFIRVNEAVHHASVKYGVPEELVWAVLWKESKYDRFALGSKGEVGLGQLMPGTAKDLRVNDRTNIDESVEATTRYLSSLLRKYSRNTDLALAAYNSGPRKVDACRCIPVASEAYVKQIKEDQFFAKRIVTYVTQFVVPSSVAADQVAAIERRASALEGQLTQQRSTSADEREKLEAELRGVRNQLQPALDEVMRLKRERDALRVQLEHEFATVIKEKDNKIQELSWDLEQREQAIVKLSKENALLKEKSEALRQSRNPDPNQFQTLATDYDASQRKIAELQRENSQLLESLRDSEPNGTDKTEITKLRERVAELNDRLNSEAKGLRGINLTDFATGGNSPSGAPSGIQNSKSVEHCRSGCGTLQNRCRSDDAFCFQRQHHVTGNQRRV